MPASATPVDKHTRPPFLEGEEDSGEIGLNDGKEVFIDDVLQTAEWCVLLIMLILLRLSKPSNQGCDTRATK
jgi:hypothetical protein